MASKRIFTYYYAMWVCMTRSIQRYIGKLYTCMAVLVEI